MMRQKYRGGSKSSHYERNNEVLRGMHGYLSNEDSATIYNPKLLTLVVSPYIVHLDVVHGHFALDQ